MQKKKVIPIAKTTIGLKCGDCLHFKLNAKFEKPCYFQGVKQYADAPPCYSPNVYNLGKKNPDALYQMGLILRDFTAQDMRILMSILKQGKSFEKNFKLKFGQPVYFHFGADYLSNYFAGFVIGVSELGEGQVFIGSDLGGKQRGKPLVASLMRDSVFTLSEWKKKHAALLKAGRVKDPKPMFGIPKVSELKGADYVPPSMDTAPPEWFTKERPLKGKDGRIAKKKMGRVLDGKLEFKVRRT